MLKLICHLKNRPAWLFAWAAALVLLLFLLRALLSGFFLLYLWLLVFLGLIGGVRLLQALLRKLCWKTTAVPKGSGSQGHPASVGINIPPHTYKRPDPMIYSQYYLLAKGIAITWDNPDIQLYDGAGAPIPSHSLAPDTSYDIRATIWNGSSDAPAINVLARFYYLSFGAGTVRNYIGEAYVNVPVKGSPLGPAEARMLWRTPPAGHYCIQVELDWIDDANPLNNLGQENVDVKKLNSPNATFTFLVRNTSALRRMLVLRADSYAIRPKEPCSGERAGGHTRDPYGRHRLASYPIPPGWTIDITGGRELLLEPGEERDVSVKITAVDGFVGTQPINVNAFDGPDLVGGVTLYVHN